MAILYKANETQFNHLGLGPLNDAISILVTEERNGIFELEMKYPVSGKVFHELKNDRIIKADAGHKLKDQRFKIIRITKPLKGIVTVYAEHVSYLTQDLALKPKVTFTGNARQALEHWKANLVDDNPFTVWSDISTTGKINWTIDEVENARRALGGVQGSILDVYGGEYQFDNYDIYLYQKRGVNSELLIAYGRNLVDLEQEEEIANTYTSIYPYSIYTDDDGKERMVTLPEYYVDSPHVNNYARRKILAVDFSNEEIKTVSALRNAANRYITDNDVGVPKVNLKIKYLDLAKTLDYKHQALLEEVNLCDNVMIYFEKYDINTTAKVIKVVWDVINERYDSIEVGEARASLSQAIDTVVDGKVHSVEKLAMQTLRTADGKNTIYFGLEEPLATEYDLKKNDIWYRIVDGEFTRTYRYDGAVWQLIIDMDSHLAKIESQQAKDEAQQAVDRANQATQQATNAINQAQSAFDEAQTALTTVSNVQGDVTNLSTLVDNHTGQISSLTQTTSGLQSSVSNLQNDFDNLEFGGRNYLKTLGDETSNNQHRTVIIENGIMKWTQKTTATSAFNILTYAEDVIDNYVLSFKSNTNQNIRGFINTSKSGTKSGTLNIKNKGDYYLVSLVLKSVNVNGSINFYGTTPFDPPQEVEFWDFKLEKGNKATDWTPAPEDIDHQFSVITQTIDSITTRVGDAEGNITALQQTSVSLAGRLTDAEGNITTLTATVNGLQTTVTNVQGDVSNVTQLADALQVRMTDAEGNISTLTQTASSLQTQIANLDDDVQSQFTQLSNNINLRVEKGDVINQINISDENILIDGNKLHITATTTIDDASIDGAKIKDASIGTAQIGTIDAAIANIINLSANSIVGGMLSAQNDRVTFDLNNGFLNINEGAISIKRPDGFTVINDGILRGEFAVQSANPPWRDSTDVRTRGQWIEVSSSQTRRVDRYTFAHMSRYLRLDISRYVEQGGGATGIIYVNDMLTGEQLWSLSFDNSSTHSSATNLQSYNIDLGSPTGGVRSIAIRARTTLRDYPVNIHIGRVSLWG